jgi:hypothetical protein
LRSLHRRVGHVLVEQGLETLLEVRSGRRNGAQSAINPPSIRQTASSNGIPDRPPNRFMTAPAFSLCCEF